jgi:hypothetical protein
MLVLHTTPKSKAQFPQNIKRKSNAQLSLVFRGATDKASVLPKFFVSSCKSFKQKLCA